MSDLRITAGPLEFGADWVEAAPRTCAAFAGMLPFVNKIIHVRWSGEAAWIPLGDLETGLGFENATSHPAPGEILLYPGGYSETEILFPYGGTCFASIVGQLAGNHFLTVTEGREQLRELGRMVLWEGAQDIRFEAPDDTRALPPYQRVRIAVDRAREAALLSGAIEGGGMLMRRVLPALAAALALALVVGCGGDDDSEEPADQGSQPQQEAKKGGDLTVLYAGDVDKIDPGHDVLPIREPSRLRGPAAALLVQARRCHQRRAGPGRGASGDIQRRQDRHRDDPQGREVQPAGEPRGDFGRRQVRARARLPPQVAGPYVVAYMGDLEGLKAFQDGDAKEIAGIQTPDDQTIVFNLDRPRGAIFAGALSLPASAPVPKEYAQKYDRRQPSAYGNNQVATGPYMIENDVRARSPATRRVARSSSSATRTGTRRPTTSRRTWTRSRSRRATIPTSRRARSSRATPRCRATSSSRPRSSRACRRATRRTSSC